MKTSFQFACLVIIAFSTVQTGLAQGLKGSIQTETGEPIPYANIYVPSRNTGTVADQSGNFELSNNTSIQPTDTLKISAIGFEHLMVLADPEVLQHIRLIPRSYELAQAEVSASPQSFSKKRTIGYKRKLGFGFTFGGFAWANNETSLGVEFGVQLDSKPGYRLEGLEMDLRALKKDSSNAQNNQRYIIGFISLPPREADVVFEVNVYELDDNGIPGEALQKEPIYWTISPRSKGKISLDLSDKPIVVTGPVVVTLEGITEEGHGIELWMPSTLTGGDNFIKSSSGTWKKSDQTMALRGVFGSAR